MTATAAPTLSTERLTLRGPEPRDAEPFIGFFTSARAGPSGNRFDRAGAWRLFASAIGHWHMRGYGMWTVTLSGDDTPVGMVGCLHYDEWPEPEIAWFLWDGAEGHGYATEAARASLAHVYGTLGWHTAVSYIQPAARRSIALAERLGAHVEPGAHHPGDAPCLVYRHLGPEAA